MIEITKLDAMDALARDKHPPYGARAQIAATLANYYAELSDLTDPEEPFSLARILQSCAERKPLVGREADVLRSAALLMDQSFNPHRLWLPLRALDTRAMGTTPGSKGGYLASAQVGDVHDVLRPYSVVASAGVQMMVGLRESVVIPRTTTATTASWIGENAAAATETPPSLGAVSLTPRTSIAFIKFSIQLLRQGESVEQFLRAQLLGAIGEVLDIAFFAGAGGVQPLGLLNTSGIGTQSGTSLAHAGVLAMRKAVLTAGAREENLQWVGTPAAQELLAARERVATAGEFIWDTDGVLGLPSVATKNAPTGALVLGDFSQSTIGIFGAGVRIDIDPSQDFSTAGLVARVLLLCDIAFPQPSAFSVATSIT